MIVKISRDNERYKKHIKLIYIKQIQIQLNIHKYKWNEINELNDLSGEKELIQSFFPLFQ